MITATIETNTWFCAGWVVQILATEFGKYT